MEQQDQEQEILEPSSQSTSTAEEAHSTPDTHEESDSEADASAGTDTENGGEGGEDEADGYTPNTKYRVYDKDHEFPDQIKQVLSKENEEFFREMAEKAHGVDVMRTNFQSIKAERDQVASQMQQFATQVREISQHAAEGDFDSFFETCGIPFEKVAQWMHRKLKTQEELPPEHSGLYDESRRYRSQLRDAEKQIQASQQMAEQAMVQARATQLDTVLADPGISDIISEIETRLGETGSFRRAVIEHAAAREHATQRPVDAKEAVSSYLRLIGRTPGASKQTRPNASVTPAKKVAMAHKPATIPNVGASALAATGRKPKNLDELKQMAKATRS